MTKLALVGNGRWGKNYVKTISKIKECRLSPDYIKTRDYKDLFSFNDIDGVIIATPAKTHFKIANEFLSKGYNVLVEKPLTTSFSDALKLKKIKTKSKKVVMVGHIYNYNISFLELLRKLKKIGQIKYIESEAGSFDPQRKDVSALWDWGSHDIYMASKVFNKKPLSVRAWGVNNGKSKTEDECFLKIKFGKDAFAFIKLSWMSIEKRRIFRVIGTKGILSFDDLATNKLQLIDFNKKYIYYKTSNTEPLYNEVLEFIKCIKKNREPKSSLDEGVQTVRVMEAAERSILSGGNEIKINTV